MEIYFTQQYFYLWMLALAVLLFLPVRHLIWVLYVRRAGKKRAPEEKETFVMKRRATATAVLLCLVFSYLYVAHLFRSG
jgi:hypothetical protein